MRIVIWQIHIFMYVHCVTVQMTQADGVSKSEMYWLFRHAIALDGKLPRQICSLLIAATQSYWQRIWKNSPCRKKRTVERPVSSAFGLQRPSNVETLSHLIHKVILLKRGKLLVSPLSKLYCRERISFQCFIHSEDNFLGLSILFTASASIWFFNSSSDIVLM